MAKPKREVWLAIEEAHAALSVLDTELSQVQPHDQPHIEPCVKLVQRAKNALDKAQRHLSDALQDAQAAIDKI